MKEREVLGLRVFSVFVCCDLGKLWGEKPQIYVIFAADGCSHYFPSQAGIWVFVCSTSGLTVLPFSEAVNLHLWYRQHAICSGNKCGLATWKSPHLKRGQSKGMVVYKHWLISCSWCTAPTPAIVDSPAYSPAHFGSPWAFPTDCSHQLQNLWALFTKMDSSDPHKDPSRAIITFISKSRKLKLSRFWNLVTATRKWMTKLGPQVFQTPIPYHLSRMQISTGWIYV